LFNFTVWNINLKKLDSVLDSCFQTAVVHQ